MPKTKKVASKKTYKDNKKEPSYFDQRRMTAFFTGLLVGGAVVGVIMQVI